ncbi:hypothetical protein AGMMS49992_03170 [Clostridia bacterium]|nr:hypothetical protein AGMMS49992_03170 [Clostridia bacterium]
MASKLFEGATLGQLRAFLVAADPGDTILIPNDVVDGSDLPGQTWTTVPIKDNVTIIGTKTSGKVRIGGNGSNQANFALDRPMFGSNDGDPLSINSGSPINGITIENIHLNVDITSFYVTHPSSGSPLVWAKIGGFIQLANDVHIKDCEVSGRIEYDINDYADTIDSAGGFVGEVGSNEKGNSTFTNCVNRCNIKAGGEMEVGGIVGYCFNKIQLYSVSPRFSTID